MELSSELMALITVSSTVAASMTYARFVASSTRPGFLRLISLSPIVILLLFLPFFFNYAHSRLFANIFLVWLANFKLLLLSFDMEGPLSPSLPLLTFIATASLPIKIQTTNTKKISSSSSSSSKALLVYFTKALIWALTIKIYSYCNKIHQVSPYWFTVKCLHIYLVMDLVFTALATVVGGLLRLHLEPHFDAPVKAASLQEFWGRRWNLMMTGILRPAVYNPMKSRGRQWGWWRHSWCPG